MKSQNLICLNFKITHHFFAIVLDFSWPLISFRFNFALMSNKPATLFCNKQFCEFADVHEWPDENLKIYFLTDCEISLAWLLWLFAVKRLIRALSGWAATKKVIISFYFEWPWRLLPTFSLWTWLWHLSVNTKKAEQKHN